MADMTLQMCCQTCENVKILQHKTCFKSISFPIEYAVYTFEQFKRSNILYRPFRQLQLIVYVKQTRKLCSILNGVLEGLKKII